MDTLRKFQLVIPVVLLLGCADRQVRPSDSTLVVRASIVSGGDACDKYCSYRVKIVRTLSGSPRLLPGTLIDIKAFSFGPQLPKGDCTLYLLPYSDPLKELWTIAYTDLPPYKKAICHDLQHAET